jgi:hypothetical protein
MVDEVPPLVLVKILNDSIRGDPGVAVYPMVTTLADMLPSGCIPMPASSPLASMFRYGVIREPHGPWIGHW